MPFFVFLFTETSTRRYLLLRLMYEAWQIFPSSPTRLVSPEFRTIFFRPICVIFCGFHRPLIFESPSIPLQNSQLILSGKSLTGGISSLCSTSAVGYVNGDSTTVTTGWPLVMLIPHHARRLLHSNDHDRWPASAAAADHSLVLVLLLLRNHEHNDRNCRRGRHAQQQQPGRRRGSQRPALPRALDRAVLYRQSAAPFSCW